MLQAPGLTEAAQIQNVLIQNKIYNGLLKRYQN